MSLWEIVHLNQEWGTCSLLWTSWNVENNCRWQKI